MIRVTIELLPFGFEAGKRTLGIVEIANDGTGDRSRGNYMTRAFGKNGRCIRSACVNDWARKSRPVFELLKRCLTEMGYK